MSRIQWSESKVLKAVRKMWRQKQPLNSWHIQRFQAVFYRAAVKFFGNWPKTITAAGLDYAKIKTKRSCPKWSKQIVVETIKKLHISGEKINSNHIQHYNHPLYGAACKYFGSWGDAIEAAGINYDSVRLQENIQWDKQIIIKAIKSRKKQGMSLNGLAVNNENHALYKAARCYFGKKGWQKALSAAGINPDSLEDPKKIWTKEKVVKTIKSLNKQEMPLYGYFLCRNGYRNLFAGGVKAFGCWQKAIEAAGFDYDSVRACKPPNYWNKKQVLTKIRKLAKVGIRLSSKSIHLKYGGLFAAAIVQFGDWGSAVTAAGFDYRDHLKSWSYKAWLKQLDQQQHKTIQLQAGRLSKRRGVK